MQLVIVVIGWIFIGLGFFLFVRRWKLLRTKKIDEVTALLMEVRAFRLLSVGMVFLMVLAGWQTFLQ